jgi:hypothetical protein
MDSRIELEGEQDVATLKEELRIRMDKRKPQQRVPR